MKRLLALLLFIIPGVSFAQSTTVSGQVTDAGAQAWNNGTIVAVFVQAPNYPGFPPYTWTGGALSAQVSGTLNATGGYSFSIPSNSAITPVNSQWRFQICPQATSPCFLTPPVTITGGTQTVNATPPSILINLSGTSQPVSAYSTSEVTGAVIGSQFFLLGTGLQVCQAVSGNTCTTWAAPGSSPSNLTNYFNQFYGLSPKDYGAFGDSKTCYDGQSTGGTNFTSAMPAETITNTVINNGLQDYTVSVGNSFLPGQTVTVTGTTNGGGVFNGTFIVFRNTFAPGFTVLTNNANVASAADTGTATSTCASFTAADATPADSKYIDIYGAGAAGIILHTTIHAVSGGVVTLGTSITPGSLSSVKFRYGHDDTTALQNWVTAINNGSLTSNNLLVHSGYIPRGFFYSTKPLRFVNPLGSYCCTLDGYGSPEPFQNNNASEGFSIMGTGASTSGIVYAPGAAFNFGCTASQFNNTGQFYYGGNNLTNAGGQWNWTNLYGFALIDDNDNITAYNTTACSVFGILVSDGSAHESVGGIEIVGGHNTTSTFESWVINNLCYESHFHDMQLYSGDGAANIGNFTAASGGLSFERCSWDNIKFRGGGSTTPNVIFNVTGGGGVAQLAKITNSSFQGSTTVGQLQLQFGTAAPGELFVIENTDFLSNQAGAYDISLPNAAANSFILSLANVHLKNSAASSATNLIQNLSPAMNILISGGDFDCNVACVNGISNASGSNIYTNSTFNVGGFTGVSGTGAATVFQQTPNATGWGGAGSWQSSGLISAGTLSLTGTGACATFSATAGGAWAGSATCSGTTGAATVTITPGITAPHFWGCFGSDITSGHFLTGTQQLFSSTTCTVGFTSVTTSDNIQITAFAY